MFFIRDEARLLDLKTSIEAMGSLVDLATEVNKKGFGIRCLRGDTWRELEAIHNKAEIMLWAMIDAFSRAIAVTSDEQAQVRIDWGGDALSLGRLIYRVKGNRDRDVPQVTLFSRIQAPNAYLLAKEMIACDFSNANLKGAILRRATMTGAILNGVNLQEARLSETDLSRCQLRKASCEGANFTRAVLDGADLRETNFRGAHFEHAMLNGANISDADFRGADLTGVKLSAEQRASAMFSEGKKKRQ